MLRARSRPSSRLVCPEIPGHPLHVIQRSHLRAACFFCREDRAAYLRWLGECAARSGCALHAYVLMGNHVHLLPTPSRAGGVAAMMADLAARHARHAFETHGFAGALWEVGFEAIPVHVGRYVLACMRYIELNPVRARLVAAPAQYRWSSFRANALGEEDALLRAHAAYCALGRSAAERQAAYRAPFKQVRPGGLARRAARAP